MIPKSALFKPRRNPSALWVRHFVFTACALVIAGPWENAAAALEHSIIPEPKSITMGAGTMPLTAQSRIVVTDPQLAAHAAALQEELWMLTNWKLATVTTSPQAGDIVLKINPTIQADEEILAPKNLKLVRTRDMAHTIDVKDMAVVEGWDVRAVCEGTASILLSIVEKEGKYSIPHMKIKDWPHADFNGTMVDCGRQWIPVDALRVLVESCRLHKVRYIQLHVGDDQGYSMPSKALPKLGTSNGSCCEGVPPKLWKWEELEELEAFAAARGVGIIPELETPGHHQAMGRAYRDLFDGPGCMDMASEELYLGLDTVVGEMCSIFKSAPYFCIGCDEANNGAGAGPMAEIYKRRHAIPNDAQSLRNAHEIYIVHMKRMADICRKYGKLTIAYENFPNDARLKDDIIPLIWYPHAVAHDYQKQGWTTITVPWNEEPDWNMYKCNGSQLSKTDRVLGASSMMWQMSAVCVVNGWAWGSYRRSERTWGPDTKIDPKSYEVRVANDRVRVDRLATPVKMTMEGVDGGAVVRAQNFLTGRWLYGGKLKVSLTVANPQGGQIHYTLDDSEPTSASPVYTEPLVFEKTFMLNSALFFGDRQVGGISRAKYDWSDIDGFIRDWQVSGPYTVAGKAGADLFDVEFPPEKGDGNEAKWFTFKPAPPPEAPWVVNFDAMPGFSGEAHAAYIRCQVESPKSQPVLLYAGTNDGSKVFVNGKLVHSSNVKRGGLNDDRIPIDLKEGWNQILIKDINWTGSYSARARLRSAQDGKLEGIRTKAE